MNTTAATMMAAHQQMVNAVWSLGAIVKIEPNGFLTILRRSMEIETEPLVVTAAGTWCFSTRYSYLTSYKGLFFYTSSPQPLTLPPETEIIQVKKIAIPNM